MQTRNAILVLVLAMLTAPFATVPGVTGLGGDEPIQDPGEYPHAETVQAAARLALDTHPGIQTGPNALASTQALIQAAPGVHAAILEAYQADQPLRPVLEAQVEHLLSLTEHGQDLPADELLEMIPNTTAPRLDAALQDRLEDPTNPPSEPGQASTSESEPGPPDNCPTKSPENLQELIEWLTLGTIDYVLEAPGGPVNEDLTEFLNERVCPVWIGFIDPAVDLVFAAAYAGGGTAMWQVDETNDRAGDHYQEVYGVLDSLTDLDADGAGVVREYQWGTIPVPSVTVDDETTVFPNAQDYDADGWLDGPEIDYWNAREDEDLYTLADSAGMAARDPDANVNSDASTTSPDNFTNQHDPDSDGDALVDGDEYYTHGTYPEYADSDCAPEATACTAVTQTKYQDPARVGSPGTGDGIPDAEEIPYWDNYPEANGYTGDCDGDTIPNILDADADQDGLTDGEERIGWAPYGSSNPCDADADDDGLKDGEERQHDTNPFNPDTDGDTLPDGWEVEYAFDPRATDDADLDPDADGLDNLDEYQAGTHPRMADTDRDLLLDGEEEDEYHTDPTTWDTDDDGMPDKWEIDNNLDPRYDDANLDPDQDGPDTDDDGSPDLSFDNLAEYIYGRPGDWNEGEHGPWMGGTNATDPDTDDDGVPDGQEAWDGTPARAGTGPQGDDADQDGLDNHEEIRINTRWTRPDTDNDGLCDGGGGVACDSAGEVNGLGTNPVVDDTDDDGLSDGAEINQYATDPLRIDTDEDGIEDGKEVLEYGTNPGAQDTDNDGLTDHEEIKIYDVPGHSPDPTIADTDGDGLLDGPEMNTYYTNPADDDGDTDNDGLTDLQEANGNTNPLDEDTDNDRMPDAWEVEMGTKPRTDDAAEDPDRDGAVFGLSNYQEYMIGTHPLKEDTDGDLINDYWEYLVGLDPLADDSEADTDNDGLLNVGEYILDTKPDNADTDGDGLTDGWEAGVDTPTSPNVDLLRTDPTLLDTDGDGLEDGDEKARWDALPGADWRTDYDGDGGNADGDDGPLADEGAVVTGQTHNLRDADSDNDGFDDGQEMLVFDTLPHKPDTDGDGDTDYQEIMNYATDPRDPDSNSDTVGAPECGSGGCTDSDGDRLSDWVEINKYNTDPNDKDTDDDFINDGDERIAWGTRLVNSYLSTPDVDGDGFLDGVEFASSGLDREQFYITSPLKSDTDGDGLTDTEEDTNGLAGESAAKGDQATSPPNTQDHGSSLSCLPGEEEPCTQPVDGGQGSSSSPAPGSGDGNEDVWWDGKTDEGVPYVIGAFGIPLYGTNSNQGDDTGGRNSGDDPHADNRDTDGDWIKDGTEYPYRTHRSKDTDQDNIPDLCEYLQSDWDPDRNGVHNANDQDSDGDGLPDAGEYNGCFSDGGSTDPYDADSDEDGLCDGEEGAGTGNTDPTHPDTDEDGLSDGLENHQRTGCIIGIDWTDSEPMEHAANRPSFQPFQATEIVLPPPDKCSHPAFCMDSDLDGIMDGIEDLNFNGVVGEPGETDPTEADTDEDNVPDGVEARVFGPMSFNQVHDGYDGNLNRVPAYEWWWPLETDPLSKDTDGDGINDGFDINPKRNGLLWVEFDAYQQLQKVDPWWSGSYKPDVIFTFDIVTGLGTASFETTLIKDMPAKSPHDLASDMDSHIKEPSMTEVGDTLSYPGTSGGRVMVDVLDDVTELPKQNYDSLDQVTVRINMKDQDYDDDDTIDINPASGADLEDQVYTKTVDVISYDEGFNWELYADGSGDKDCRGPCQDDNGRLTLQVGSNLAQYFLSNAQAIQTNDPRPANDLGQCYKAGC